MFPSLRNLPHFARQAACLTHSSFCQAGDIAAVPSFHWINLLVVLRMWTGPGWNKATLWDEVYIHVCRIFFAFLICQATDGNTVVCVKENQRCFACAGFTSFLPGKGIPLNLVVYNWRSSLLHTTILLGWVLPGLWLCKASVAFKVWHSTVQSFSDRIHPSMYQLGWRQEVICKDLTVLQRILSENLKNTLRLNSSLALHGVIGGVNPERNLECIKVFISAGTNLCIFCDLMSDGKIRYQRPFSLDRCSQIPMAAVLIWPRLACNSSAYISQGFGSRETGTKVQRGVVWSAKGNYICRSQLDAIWLNENSQSAIVFFLNPSATMCALAYASLEVPTGSVVTLFCFQALLTFWSGSFGRTVPFSTLVLYQYSADSFVKGTRGREGWKELVLPQEWHPFPFELEKKLN